MKSKILSAEEAFEDAFERLRVNNPSKLPRGTAVTQNNVAREAGCDPSALKKKRYPALIKRIQDWIAENRPKDVSARQSHVKRRRDLKEINRDYKVERDRLASCLLEANTLILQIYLEKLNDEEHSTSSVVIDR